jgi:hypothetical protein
VLAKLEHDRIPVEGLAVHRDRDEQQLGAAGQALDQRGRGNGSGTYRSGTYRSGTYRSGTYRSGTYRSGTYRSGTYRSAILCGRRPRTGRAFTLGVR